MKPEKISDERLADLIAHYSSFPPQNYELTKPVVLALRELRERREKEKKETP